MSHSETRGGALRLIVFDLDGTLVDSEKYFLRALEYAVKPFNLKGDHHLIEKIRARHPEELFTDLLSVQQARRAMDRLVEKGRETVKEIRPFDGSPGIFSRY